MERLLSLLNRRFDQIFPVLNRKINQTCLLKTEMYNRKIIVQFSFYLLRTHQHTEISFCQLLHNKKLCRKEN